MVSCIMQPFCSENTRVTPCIDNFSRFGGNEFVTVGNNYCKFIALSIQDGQIMYKKVKKKDHNSYCYFGWVKVLGLLK